MRESADPRVRIVATADLHFGRHPVETYSSFLTMAAKEAEVMCVCGDLTDHGRPEEAEGLAQVFRQVVHIPIVAVLGNHDYESGQPDAVRDILGRAGVQMLDGDSVEIGGIGFAGTKGFCGGFGPRALGPWGEPIIKAFVQETIAEALKLETALARLRAAPRIALLHYSPVAATVEGEPLEIFPFLGSTRLEEPLTRYDVAAVFHGHAHHGQPEGQTSKGAPVFNVSMPLLQRLSPERPFRHFDAMPAP
ncbi:MAG TPA: metallophosphoesterase [Vicinamibacterales bacterium]|nr:metallophosphoesterase [Vicinamibacterales bacterium]